MHQLSLPVCSSFICWSTILAREKHSKKKTMNKRPPPPTLPMATFHRLLKPPMIFTLLLHLSLLLPLTIAAAADDSAGSSSIHDLLISQGLPAGLFPKDAVTSYVLDGDGHLQVFLEKPCLAKFETRVFFDSVVRANLTYGGLTGVEGLSQEELFLWLPVKDIIVYDPSSGLILFDIGLAHKQMSLSLFEDPPACNPQGEIKEKNVEEDGVQVQSQ